MTRDRFRQPPLRSEDPSPAVTVPQVSSKAAKAEGQFPAELEPFLDAFVDMIVEDLLALPPETKP